MSEISIQDQYPPPHLTDKEWDDFDTMCSRFLPAPGSSSDVDNSDGPTVTLLEPKNSHIQTKVTVIPLDVVSPPIPDSSQQAVPAEPDTNPTPAQQPCRKLRVVKTPKAPKAAVSKSKTHEPDVLLVGAEPADSTYGLAKLMISNSTSPSDTSVSTKTNALHFVVIMGHRPSVYHTLDLAMRAVGSRGTMHVFDNLADANAAFVTAFENQQLIVVSDNGTQRPIVDSLEW